MFKQQFGTGFKIDSKKKLKPQINEDIDPENFLNRINQDSSDDE